MLSLLAVAILLPAILYALLNVNAVQHYLVNRVSDYFSRELQTEISVGGVDIRLFRSIVLKDVVIEDQSGEKLLAVKDLDLQLNAISFRHKSIDVRKIRLEEASLDLYTANDQKHPNYQFILDYFDDRDVRPEDERWLFNLGAFQIKGSGIQYRDLNHDARKTGFDPSHFSLKDFDLYVKEIRRAHEFAAFTIDHLRYTEASGFAVNKLGGKIILHQNMLTVEGFVLQTRDSGIAFDLEMHFTENTRPANSFEGLRFVVDIEESRVDLAEIGHYYSPLQGMHDLLYLHGAIRGSDTHIQGENIRLAYGENILLDADWMLTNLGNELSPHLTMQVHDMRSNIRDILSFSLPETFDWEYPQLPQYLNAFGDISFSGLLAGTVHDFLAEGTLHTGIGSLQSDIEVFREDKEKDYSYRGYLAAQNFYLDKMFANPDLPAKVNMHAELQGSGFEPGNLNMHINGAVESMVVRDVSYKDIVLAGDFANQRFDGTFAVDDENLRLDFHGIVDLEAKVPLFQFNARIDRANLTDMKLFQRNSLYESVLSAELSVDASGSALDDMQGELTIRDIRYGEIPLDPAELEVFPVIYQKDSIYVSNRRWSETNHHLRVRSDFADIDIHGKIRFDQLTESMRTFAAMYLPSSKIGAASEDSIASDQDLSFSVRMKDTQLLTELFLPGVSLSEGSWLNGTFSDRQRSLSFEGYADTLSVAGRSFIGYGITGQDNDTGYGINMTSDRFMISEQRHLEDFVLSNTVRKDSLYSDIRWGQGRSGSGRGFIKGITHFVDEHLIEITIPQSELIINGTTWRFNTDNRIILDSNRVEVYQLMAYHDNQFIKAHGAFSSFPGDRMGLSFADFNLDHTSILLGDRNFDFGGIIDGHISLTGLYQPPGIAADISVRDFSFNKDLMGDLEVQSSWNDVIQAFDVYAAVTYHGNVGSNQPLIASGNLYTGDEGDNFDLDIDLTNFKMSVWGRYLQSFADNFRGIASGQLRMEGAFSSPELSGNLRLSRMGMHIPYLNTSYTFAHEVEIEKDRFRFENLVLNDTIGNTALVNGTIMHDIFSNFAIDIDARPENMVLLNTTSASNEIFFGTAFLTGLARFHGPVNNITLDVSATTERGTRIMMPLNYTGDIRERHFISFVSHDEESEEALPFQPRTGGEITLNFDLEVTPEAEVELFFDAQFGDIIRGRGSGDINLEILPDGSFNIYGEYAIQSGEYLFTLQNIINKRFRIEQGSNIRWTGDLNEADVDLRAIYRLRTSLYDLLAGGGTDDDLANQFRRRVPVETVLILEDKLFNPDISFDINIPGGDDTVRELIEREITTDQEMNRQVFSLLLLNRFMPRDQYAALGYGMGATSSELLSHQLSNWLSQISSDFDIGVNYRPGDEITSQEVELALSTQLFDDRVLIDGNFGVAGNQTATGQQTQAANQFIGDINVEVKITPEGKFRVKAFNRSNTFDIIHTNAPYTQGIGLFYRREFDRLHDLFRRQRLPGEHAPAEENNSTENGYIDLSGGQ